MNHLGIPLGKIVSVLTKVDLVDQDLGKKTIKNLDIPNSESRTGADWAAPVPHIQVGSGRRV